MTGQKQTSRPTTAGPRQPEPGTVGGAAAADRYEPGAVRAITDIHQAILTHRCAIICWRRLKSSAGLSP